MNSPYCLVSLLGFLTSFALGRLCMRTRTRLSMTSISFNNRRDSSKEVLTDSTEVLTDFSALPTSVIYRTRLRLYVR